MNDLDQIALVLHDLVDVLIAARNLIEDGVILPALNALGLLFEIGHGKGTASLGAAHLSARTMRARAIRLEIYLAADDVTALPHRTGDDAQIALACPNRTLARHPQIFSEVVLAFDIIVMAVVCYDSVSEIPP